MRRASSGKREPTSTVVSMILACSSRIILRKAACFSSKSATGRFSSAGFGTSAADASGGRAGKARTVRGVRGGTIRAGDARRHDRLRHMHGIAKRTENKSTLRLLIEAGAICKPAVEFVRV